MGKLLKWSMGIFGGLLLLLVVAIVALPILVDPNDHKDRLLQLVKDQTGRELVINDRLELSVFPSLGVTTGGVTLSNASGFGKEPFAKINTLDLRIKLMPLFSSRLEVDTLVLNGLTLNLAKDKNGRTNWEDLAGKTKKKEAEATPDKSAQAFAFNLSGVQVEQAKLVWDDRQSGEHYVLENVSLQTGVIAPGSQVPVQMAFGLSSEKPKLKLGFQLKSTLGMSADLKVLDMPDLAVELEAEGEGLPAGGVDMRLSASVSVDQTRDTLSVKNLKVSGAGVSLSGAVEGDELSTKPSFKGSVSLAQTNLRNLVALFGAAPDTADAEVLKSLSGELGILATTGSLSIKPLRLKLDDSQLNGSFSMPSFKGPALRFALDLDTIDLDRYLPAAGKEPAEQPGDKPATDDPLAALRTLDLNGQLNIGSLKLKNLRMQKVQVKMHARNGTLKIEPAKADLYQGKFNGNVTVDARNKTPRIHAVKQLTGVQIGPLMKDLADSDRLSGTGEFHADLNLVGLSEAEIRESLNGTSRFEFKDGAVKGINIAQTIRQAKSGLSTGKVGEDTTQQTDFSSLSGSAVIRNGVVSNNDLQALSPLLRVKGEGKLDLPADTMNYLVTATLVKSLEGQGGKSNDQLTGIPIPVRLTGPLTKPEYSIDLKAVLTSKAKQKVEEKLMEKLAPKEGGGGILGDRLKGLLQR